MLPRRSILKIAIEITAAGTEAETVRPANMPRYAFAPDSTSDSTDPRITTPTVSSGRFVDAGIYGSTLAWVVLGSSAMARLSLRGGAGVKVTPAKPLPRSVDRAHAAVYVPRSVTTSDNDEQRRIDEDTRR